MTDAFQNPDQARPGLAGGGLPPPVPAGGIARRAALPAAVWVLVAISLLVAVAGTTLAWRAQQRVSGIEQELVKRQQDSAGQATEARVLSKAADDSSRESAAKVALLEARVAEVSMQRGQLDDVIRELSRSRDENVLADIEGAVRVAMQQMLITGSAEPLVATLQQSDERLARANQPRLDTLRRAVARDLEKVRAAGNVNIATLSFKLDDVVRLVDELPLLSTADARSATSPAGQIAQAPASVRSGSRSPVQPVSASLAASAPGWSHEWLDTWNTFWGVVWNEARGLVRVTRIDHPEAMLVAPDNVFFLRENLKLRLLNARLAVLSRQFDTAQADLQTIQSALDRYFDRSSRKVVLAIDTVRQVSVQARQVALPRPDDTLAALTALASVR